jgi:hypothetical protein
VRDLRKGGHAKMHEIPDSRNPWLSDAPEALVGTLMVPLLWFPPRSITP